MNASRDRHRRLEPFDLTDSKLSTLLRLAQSCGLSLARQLSCETADRTVFSSYTYYAHYILKPSIQAPSRLSLTWNTCHIGSKRLIKLCVMMRQSSLKHSFYFCAIIPLDFTTMPGNKTFRTNTEVYWDSPHSNVNTTDEQHLLCRELESGV